MNEERKKEWVAALRSGDYKQGKHTLRHEDSFCCLGVACDLAVKAGAVSYEVSFDWKTYLYGADKQSRILPKDVIEWLGLEEDDDPHNPRVGDYPTGLAQLNDDGVSFEDIADAIEKNL